MSVRGRLPDQRSLPLAALLLGATAVVACNRGGDPVQEPAHEQQAPQRGPGRVHISPERQQLIGVRTAVVEPRDLTLSIRTVGILSYDQTRVTQINTRVSGWVEQLYVDYVGKPVRKGEPLLTLYSPQLVSAQVDHLLAVKQQSLPGAKVSPGPYGTLTAATRQRLKLWEVSDDQIARLERTGKPERTLTLYAPFTGVVVERNTYAGQYLSPDFTAFRIADLSTIWVLADVFEYEQQRVAVGQQGTVLFPARQGLTPLEGTVTFIDPGIDPQTRRIRLRLEFPNPGEAFKPDTFVTVVIRSPQGRQLAIPREAIIDTGTRQYALLALPDGYFEPREVRVGPPADEVYPVLGGLQQGDRVVTSAQFLVDSETNLMAAMQAMAGMPGTKRVARKGEMPETDGGRPGMPLDGGRMDGGMQMPGMRPGQP